MASHKNWRYFTVGILSPVSPLIYEGNCSWIWTEEIPKQHTHSGLNAIHIMAYPFLGGIVFMVLCRVLYDVIWSRQKIASVRQQTRFEGTGLNMGKVKSKSARDMA